MIYRLLLLWDIDRMAKRSNFALWSCWSCWSSPRLEDDSRLASSSEMCYSQQTFPFNVIVLCCLQICSLGLYSWPTQELRLQCSLIRRSLLCEVRYALHCGPIIPASRSNGVQIWPTLCCMIRVNCAHLSLRGSLRVRCATEGMLSIGMRHLVYRTI